MPTSFIVGFCLMGLLCIVCLSASMAILIKAQELQGKCIVILDYAFDWLRRTEHEQEVNAHEGTE